MKLFNTLFWVLAFVCLSQTDLTAQNAQTISIQGTLKDASGGAVPDGNRPLTFKLYDALENGNEVWSETENSVSVSGGIYSHQLGSVTPLDGGDFLGPRWVEVVVDGTPLIPRIGLSYAPYAMAVASAAQVSPGGCSGQVGDIKYSILNPTQFQTQNGDCWVPMDGRGMSGSTLAGITGQSALPNGSGMFLRAQEYAGSGREADDDRTASTPPGSYQGDSYELHGHSMNSAGSHTHDYEDSYFWKASRTDGTVLIATVFPPREGASAILINYAPTNGVRNGIKFENTKFDDTTDDAGGHTHTINSSGSAETRPENLNFYLYIRIN